MAISSKFLIIIASVFITSALAATNQGYGILAGQNDVDYDICPLYAFHYNIQDVYCPLGIFCFSGNFQGIYYPTSTLPLYPFAWIDLAALSSNYGPRASIYQSLLLTRVTDSDYTSVVVAKPSCANSSWELFDASQTSATQVRVNNYLFYCDAGFISINGGPSYWASGDSTISLFATQLAATVSSSQAIKDSGIDADGHCRLPKAKL